MAKIKIVDASFNSYNKLYSIKPSYFTGNIIYVKPDPEAANAADFYFYWNYWQTPNKTKKDQGENKKQEQIRFLYV